MNTTPIAPITIAAAQIKPLTLTRQESDSMGVIDVPTTIIMELKPLDRTRYISH